jgi:hypothetical protein
MLTLLLLLLMMMIMIKCTDRHSPVSRIQQMEWPLCNAPSRTHLKRKQQQKKLHETESRRLHRVLILWCIQKFPDWPPGARTANGTALCH